MTRLHTDFFRIAGLARDERGAAAVEFALVAPVLFLLAAGAIDTTRMISQTMQVRAAAQAGADFALNNGVNPWNPAAIQTAVTSATALAITPTATQETGCVSGQAIVPANGALCPAGGTPGVFVNVAARASFQPLVPWNGVVLPSQLNASATVRVS